MVKKCLTIGIILLLVSIGFAPSLFADVGTINEKNELVELTIEFYGLDKTNSHELTVTREDSERLDLLFDDVRNELNNATTNLERISIFNDCIVELDKLGLLGDNSIEDVKRITTELYKEKLFSYIENAEKNYNCLIIGKTSFTRFFCDSYENFWYNILKNIVEPFLDSIQNDILRMILFWPLAIYILLHGYNIVNILQLGSTITYGVKLDNYDEPPETYLADGWVWTLGKNGVVEFDGGKGQLGVISRVFGIFPEFSYEYYYIGVGFFLGIRLVGLGFGNKYIGFASEVSIG